MAFPDDPPSLAERQAIRRALVAFKRFWNASSEADEDQQVQNLIDAITELVKESER
jgi:hypothetical protein